jgi:hypothetical protein
MKGVVIGYASHTGQVPSGKLAAEDWSLENGNVKMLLIDIMLRRGRTNNSSSCTEIGSHCNI